MDTEDQVVRLRRFEGEHPEWQILSPASVRSILRGEPDWRALGPGGEFIRAVELSDLLDEIARTTEGA